MSVYLSNAFSLQMQGGLHAECSPISDSNAIDALVDIQRNKSAGDDEGEHSGETRRFPKAFVSVVGHADIAGIISQRLGVPVGVNRVAITLTVDDTLYVCQYIGQRLPEGCKELPEGAQLKWYRVTVSLESRAEIDARKTDAVIRDNRTARDGRLRAWGLDPQKIDLFLAAEDAAYCGYPDDDGRERLAAKAGITRKQLDWLI